MVNPVSSSGVQSFTTVQPSFTQGAEQKANTDQVQPRSAPAADSQRADSRDTASRDNNQIAFRDVGSSAGSKTAAPAPTKDFYSSRGGNLDVVV